MISNPQCLLDSNILIALIDNADVLHKRAVTLLEKLSDENYEFYYSDVLINEVLSVLAHRCEAKNKKSDFKLLSNTLFKHLYGQPILCLYELVAANFQTLKNIMTEHDGVFNFHDALILLFLKPVPEVNLVTFDDDFKKIKNLNVIS